MDKKSAIQEYLQKHHTGEQKAVCSKELQRLFSLDGRSLRRKVNRLRQEGVPICSGAAGYYYAASQQEINETVNRLNHMVTRVSNARTGLLHAALLPHSGLTVEIHIELKEGS